MFDVKFCECGGECDRGQTKCPTCLRVQARRDAIDDSLRRQYDPKHTLPMFGDEEKK